MRINNVSDLAAHLGAYHDTEASIAKRIFKDTSCGCSTGIETGSVGERDKIYTVQCHISILGYKILSWRLHGKPRKLSHKEAMPAGLAEYLLIGKQKSGVAPVLCSDGLTPQETVRQHGSDWMKNLALDDQLLKKTYRGKAVYLTVKVKEPIIKPYFWVAGYCEGSDSEHPIHQVAFPCTGEEIDKAIAQADQDGVDTWNATHGCEDCGEPEWGMIDRAVNPDCTTCKGQGIII